MVFYPRTVTSSYLSEGFVNILLTNSSDIYGGGEFYVSELATALNSRGHVAYVACKPGNLLSDKCRRRNVDVVEVDFPPKGKLMKFIRLLSRTIRDFAIDVVHTNSNYDRTAGAFAARLCGIPHVTNVHSFHSLQHNVTHWLRNRFATDHFIVDGYCVQELLTKEDGIAGDRISVIYLGVDPATMVRDEVVRRRVRRELGIEDGMTLIGNVGRLVPMKGQEYLLRAFAHVAQDHPSARLAIVGDGELLENLSKLAQALGVGKSVVMTGFRDDLVSIYSAFDVYVHSSVEGGGETFPFAVLQALSEELPLIVTRVGDVAAMVEEGVNGFVVPDRNPEALAARLDLLLRDKAQSGQMAAKSRELLLARFTTEHMVQGILTVYEKLHKARSVS